MHPCTTLAQDDGGLSDHRASASASAVTTSPRRTTSAPRTTRSRGPIDGASPSRTPPSTRMSMSDRPPAVDATSTGLLPG
ncbi:hypothetical protein [Ornithinimicrobium kibberense]|uniref:hypothetical protein n=1 Tax=Ornithinimicrobium kibberense TaxID=282060 RepID=UPI00361E5936